MKINNHVHLQEQDAGEVFEKTLNIISSITGGASIRPPKKDKTFNGSSFSAIIYVVNTSFVVRENKDSEVIKLLNTQFHYFYNLQAINYSPTSL